MTIIFREIDRQVYLAVKSGQKTIETRAATSRYLKVEKGYSITFKCAGDRFIKNVKSVRHFRTVEDLAQSFPIASVLPGARSVDDLTNMYNGFPGYKDKIAKYGIVAWELI